MIKGDYDYLRGLAEVNECAEHGTPLEVARHPDEAQYVIRCGHGEYPDNIRHIPSYTQEYKQGKLGTGPVADNVKKALQRRSDPPGKDPGAFHIEGVPGRDLATGEMLSKEKMYALVNYARKYELDPMRGHVCLMYGDPYITIDGYLYHANKSGKPYTLSSHPLTPDEKKDYMIDPADHAWLALVTFPGTDTSFSGIGIVTQGEMLARSTRKPDQLRSPVVASHPWQLGQKRAEWQALRRAFPIGETKDKEEA